VVCRCLAHHSPNQITRPNPRQSLKIQNGRSSRARWRELPHRGNDYKRAAPEAITSFRQSGSREAMGTMEELDSKAAAKKIDAARAGIFPLGGDLNVHRLGFGTMRLTGGGIWGMPRDPEEARRVLRRAVVDL